MFSFHRIALPFFSVPCLSFSFLFFSLCSSRFLFFFFHSVLALFLMGLASISFHTKTNLARVARVTSDSITGHPTAASSHLLTCFQWRGPLPPVGSEILASIVGLCDVACTHVITVRPESYDSESCTRSNKLVFVRSFHLRRVRRSTLARSGAVWLFGVAGFFT